MHKDIIIRFLKGTCNTEESEKVYQWWKTENSERELEQMIGGDLARAFEKKAERRKDLDHLLPGIFAADHTGETGRPGIYPKENLSHLTVGAPKKSPWRYVKWAASVLVVLSLSFVLYLVQKEARLSQLPKEESISMIVKSNGYGRKSTIFLSDGTAVYLDSDSRITYPSRFKGDQREVYLTGEAYFDVAHDPAKPFIVKAGPVNIKVLGTEFNVRAFSGDGIIKVSLEQGQVEISNEVNRRGISDKLFLSPGQSVVYHVRKAGFEHVKRFDPMEDCAWKDGIIYFKKANFNEVIYKLKKWYNVQFEVVNKPSSVWSYSGSFNNQNLDNVLRSIGFSQGFSYEIMSDKVLIQFNDKTDAPAP